MRVLALDLATRTGWCVGVAGEPVRVGTHDISRAGDHVGRFLNAHQEFMNKALASGTIDRVWFEAPILQGGNGLKTLIKLYGLAGVTQMVCLQHKVPVEGVNLATVKKMLTGSGRADKPAMIAAAQARGVDVQDDNQADAFGIYLCALKQHAPDHLSAYAAEGALL